MAGRIVLLFALLLGFSHTAHAAPTLKVASTSEACSVERHEIAQRALALGYPDDWSIYVVCDKLTWERLLEHYDARKTDTAFTVIKAKLTILFPASPHYTEHTLKHELGHVRCACTDEEMAEKSAPR